jgi:NitT/TauT family transport system substrate-binding protein
MSLRRPRSLTARIAALPLLALLPLSACHKQQSDTSGLIHVSLQTDWYPQPEHGGFYDAVAKGYYRAEGLDVKILPGGPYTASAALVANGTIQFAMDSSDHILQAIANNNEPLIAIGATMQYDPQCVMFHADAPIHSWADLNGHTVAVRPGSTWWTFVVKQFHLDHVKEIPLTYSVANFVRDPNYIQQCFVTSEPYFADRAGTPARTLLTSDAGFKPYRVFITSRTFLDQHPDIVARFTRASIRGWQDYMQDPSTANAMIQKLNPAMNRDWMKYSYNALKSGNFITGPDTSGAQVGQLDPARWLTLYNQLQSLGVLHHPIDPTSAYTTQFLK